MTYQLRQQLESVWLDTESTDGEPPPSAAGGSACLQCRHCCWPQAATATAFSTTKLQLQLSLLSVFRWISWTGSYDVTKIRPHTMRFVIHFGFENMSFALNINKNAKPENPDFAWPKHRFLGLENGRVTWVPGFGETWVYNPNYTCVTHYRLGAVCLLVTIYISCWLVCSTSP